MRIRLELGEQALEVEGLTVREFFGMVYELWPEVQRRPPEKRSVPRARPTPCETERIHGRVNLDSLEARS